MTKLEDQESFKVHVLIYHIPCERNSSYVLCPDQLERKVDMQARWELWHAQQGSQQGDWRSGPSGFP